MPFRDATCTRIWTQLIKHTSYSDNRYVTCAPIWFYCTLISWKLYILKSRVLRFCFIWFSNRLHVSIQDIFNIYCHGIHSLFYSPTSHFFVLQLIQFFILYIYIYREREREREWEREVGWLFGFYGISTFVGLFNYIMPNPFLNKNQFYFKQFNLAWVNSLIIKNISISSYSVYSNSIVQTANSS